VLKKDIKFYLTSIDYGLYQNNYSQSLGGYISLSPVYKESITSSDVKLYSNEDINLSENNIDNSNFISIDKEIIKINSIDNKIDIKNRGYNSLNKFHLQGKRIFGLENNLFNSLSYSQDKAQYRCIAVKNESVSNSIKNIYIYNNDQYNDSSKMEFAIEVPIADYYSGTIDDGSNISFKDDSLIDIAENNHFRDCVFETTFESIIYKTIINTYDSDSGVIVFYSSLAINLVSGMTYKIYPTPAQRIKNGTMPPSKNSYISDFTNSEIGFNVNSKRRNENIFKPNDIFYIWIKRKLNRGKDAYNNNISFINIKYREVS
jgi:hypothetical protein